MNKFLISTIVLCLVFAGCRRDKNNPIESIELVYATDIDANTYKTIRIGRQLWLAENLKVTHYRNGDPIAKVTDHNEWNNLTTGAYCSYANNDTNMEIYGLLYNWYAVYDERGLAPNGWHIPTDAEWKELEIYLGMSASASDSIGPRGTDEGGKLKENSTIYWQSPNSGATNISGFEALPGGYRLSNKGYFELCGTGMWWATRNSVNDPYSAWTRSLMYNHAQVDRMYLFGQSSFGFFVRCVRN